MTSALPEHEKSHGFPRSEKTYAVLACCFAVVLVLTNIIGVKLFHAWRPPFVPGEGPLTLTSGIITYPLTFLLTDLVAEIWGKQRARLMVWMGFGFSVLMLLIVKMAKVLPISPFWENPQLGLGAEELQSAFEATFFYPALLLGASMTAYLVAQLFDVNLYHFWWKVTRGRHMWVRNNGSTMISQLVDTIIVNGIFLHWGLQMEWGTVWQIILAVYLYKLAFALLDTPLIYLGRAILRRFLDLPRDAAPGVAPLA